MRFVAQMERAHACLAEAAPGYEGVLPETEQIVKAAQLFGAYKTSVDEQQVTARRMLEHLAVRSGIEADKRATLVEGLTDAFAATAQGAALSGYVLGVSRGMYFMTQVEKRTVRGPHEDGAR
jgi:hypothetical protein